MSILVEYIKTIVTYSVLSALCIHLLPGKRYQRYAGFTIGLIYICIFLDMIEELIVMLSG